MSNVFRQFQKLVTTTKTDIVEIISNNGDGTSTATTLSGETVIVRGETVAAGNRAVIQNGNVVEQGPSGAVLDLTIF